MRENSKKGLSPVIATTLLVAMVVVLGLTIFLWFKGFSGENITKFGGTNVNLVCRDVQFESSYSDGQLFISNIGNVPIFSFKIKTEGATGSDVYDIAETAVGDWPPSGLNIGGTFIGNIISITDGAQQITLIPVLIGTSDKDNTPKSHVCNEEFGEIINV